jgi:hypothetical protein
MKRFFYDILRDKGSTKFSITKFLAFATFTFFLGYMAIYLLWLKEPIDHTLIIELIGFMLTLLGFKNGWGINKTKKPEETISITTFEASPMDSKDEDEALF